MISEAKAEAGATRWQDQFYCNIGLLFGAVIFDRDRRQVVKCDLCGGIEPWCVRFCEPGALSYKPPSAVGMDKKRAAARRLLEGMGL